MAPGKEWNLWMKINNFLSWKAWGARPSRAAWLWWCSGGVTHTEPCSDEGKRVGDWETGVERGCQPPQLQLSGWNALFSKILSMGKWRHVQKKGTFSWCQRLCSWYDGEELLWPREHLREDQAPAQNTSVVWLQRGWSQPPWPPQELFVVT